MEKVEAQNKYTAAWANARELTESVLLDAQQMQEMEASLSIDENELQEMEASLGIDENKINDQKEDEQMAGQEQDRKVVSPVESTMCEDDEDADKKVAEQGEPESIVGPLSLPAQEPWLHQPAVVEMDVDDSDVDSLLSSDDDDDDDYSRTTKHGLDMRLLTLTLDQGKAATAEINKDSDVVLVLGGTGAGKSTFIQAMNGKKLVRGWDETMGKSCFVVDGEEELDGFEIGHGLHSRTRHVRSFFREASSTFYVDSSGFGDSKAIETDIATSICIRDLGQRARRLRFVVLINANQFSSDRADELKRRLKVVTNIIGDNFSEHRRSFTFLFTHCNNAFDTARDLLRAPRENRAKIPKEVILDSMKTTLVTLLSETTKATQDKSTQSLVRSLKKSLEKGLPYCDVFDPSLSDVATIRAKLEPASVGCKMIMSQPDKHVRCSLTFAAIQSIQHEVKARQQGIIYKLQEPGSLFS